MHKTLSRHIVTLFVLFLIYFGIMHSFAGNAHQGENACPVDMVCLDGEIVPDIGLLPIIPPIPRSNLNYGPGPITLSSTIIKGEIIQVYEDPANSERTAYLIEDPYGHTHLVRSFQTSDETTESSEKVFALGKRVIAYVREANRPPLSNGATVYPEGVLTPWPLDEKEELGRKLFCDNRLDRSDKYGCATCHRPNHGFADITETSLGKGGLFGSRNTPTLYNVAHLRPLFWDGRAVSLEEQAFHPLMNPSEMDMTGKDLLRKLGKVRELTILELPRRSVITIRLDTISRKLLQAATVKAVDATAVWGKNALRLYAEANQETRGVQVQMLGNGNHPTVAGLLVEDIIQELNGYSVLSEESFRSAVNDLPVDKTVKVKALRRTPPITKAILQSLTVHTMVASEWEEQVLPNNTQGVQIRGMAVEENRTPAETAGLRMDDIIQKINEGSVETEGEYWSQLERLAGDQEVTVAVLRKGKHYSTYFKEVFGAEMNLQAIAEAISAYERSISLTDTVFDRYLLGLNPPEFGEDEKIGLALFRGKARCILCHNGPNFTDGKFHNVGYPVDDTNHYLLNDVGRYRVTRKDRDKGAFRTPTLRGVAETYPYMHDGEVPKKQALLTETQKQTNGLTEAVRFFNHGGGNEVPNPDPLMKPLGLSDDEQKYLIAFLKTLSRPHGRSRSSVCPTLPAMDNK